MALPGAHARIADNDNHATEHAAVQSNLTMNGKLVLQWGQEEVQMWLDQNGFRDMMSAFGEHNIDGQVLSRINDALLKEMGITNVGRRLHLQNMIQKVQVVARNQWRSTALWASEEYRPGPCNNLLPFGFPLCCGPCIGKPDLYTLTNSKINISHNEKNVKIPFCGCCGYTAVSNNVDLSVVQDVDSVNMTSCIGEPAGVIFVNQKPGTGMGVRFTLQSGMVPKVVALVNMAKEEAAVYENIQAMQMFR